MSETLTLVLAGLAGAGIGAFFFGGLWWTVRKGVSSSRPTLWFLGSLLLRTSVTIAGFYFVGGAQWQRLLSCLAGFIIVRIVMALLFHLPVKSPKTRAPEAKHAP